MAQSRSLSKANLTASIFLVLIAAAPAAPLANCRREWELEIKIYKTGVIYDPLGQPTVPALDLKFWDGRSDEQPVNISLLAGTVVELVDQQGKCHRPDPQAR